MRSTKLAALCFHLLFVVSAYPAIALVQNPTGATAAATGVSKAFASAPTVGNYIFAAFGVWNSSTAISTITSVTDNATGGSNTYNLVLTKTITNASGDRGAIWIYQASVARTVSALTVSVATTNGGGSFGISLNIAEFSGIAASTPGDSTNSGATTSSSPSSGALTPTQSGDLFIGAMGYGGSAATIATTTTGGWATLQITDATDANQSIATSYLIATDATAKTAAWTLGSSQKWAAIIGGFKSATGATAVVKDLMTRGAIATPR